tara:strand:+ start:1639 stop:2040 length:402 start_codon:yes stop_codon:yes gene_type:complete
MAHASVGTYDVTAQFPASVIIGRRALMTQPITGVVQHRQALSSVMPNGQAAVRLWTLQTSNCTVTDYHRMVALWDLTAGGCEVLTLAVRGFDFGGGASESVQVRMISQPMNLTSNGPNYYSFTMELEEFGHAP